MAGNRIAQQLFITIPINVLVIFTPLKDTCQFNNYLNIGSCLYQPTLSQTIPTTLGITRLIFLAARKDGGPLLVYPQAAVKQHVKTRANQFDIQIYFNSNLNWYYSRPFEKFEQTKYDLECNIY